MELKKFNLKEKLSIDPASTILIVGARRVGKTEYAKYLVNTIKPLYGLIILFTNSNSSRRQWDHLIGKKYSFIGYRPKVIKYLFKRDEIMRKETPDLNPNALVIFDDVIDDKKIHNDQMLEALFSRGRHNNIGVIFISQYLNSISPLMRVNSDIVIVTIQTSLQSFDILHDSYGLISKKDFIKLINQHTEDHTVFVIRNDKLSNNPEIKYQWDKQNRLIK